LGGTTTRLDGEEVLGNGATASTAGALKLNAPDVPESAPAEDRALGFASGFETVFVATLAEEFLVDAPLKSALESFLTTGCEGLLTLAEVFETAISLPATFFDSEGFEEEFSTARAEVFVFATALVPDAGSALAWRSLRPAVHPTELKAIAPAKT
jgi:hypothetical protein